jgi:dCMP deaminase
MTTADERLSLDAYFLGLARASAARAGCVRRQHGAVVVARRRVVAGGCTGGPSGPSHCDDGACPAAGTDLPPGHDDTRCIAIHAEADALLSCSPDQRDGASLYCTTAPCFACAKLIANSGVSEVVAAGGRYAGWDEVRDFLRRTGVRVRVLDGLEGLPVLDLS